MKHTFLRRNFYGYVLFSMRTNRKNEGCKIKGVCGKNADTANLQDKLISSLVELANCNEKTEGNINLIIEGLFVTITNVNYDNVFIEEFTKNVKKMLNAILNLILKPCGKKKTKI